MNDMMQVIAEAEGVRTPTRKRTRKELEEIHANYMKKKAAKKTAAPKKPVAPKPAAAVKPKQTPVYATAVPMNYVSETGYVREVAYDAKSKMFYVAFAKSTWAMPSSKAEWDGVEKAIADPNVDFDAYYRKTFRGRTAQMLPVKRAAEAV